MKIAIFSDTFPPAVNGVANAAYLMAKNLAEAGHEVAVFAAVKKLKNRPDIAADKFKVYRLPSLPAPVYKGERMALPLGLCLYYLRKFKPDIIHTHTLFGVGTEAVLAAKILKIPLVGTHHTFYDHYLKHVKLDFGWMKKLSWKMTAGYYNRCNLVLSPSKVLADTLVDKGLTCSIAALQNTIDTDLFRPADSEEKAKAKKRFSVQTSSVCYMGRLSYEKSINQVIRAFALMQEQLPELNLMLIGDGPERKKLEKLAGELGIKKQVIFTGMVFKNDLVEAVQANEVFLSASKSENMPLSILEVMATGLPLILVREKGLAQLVQEDVNGFFVKTDDPADMAVKTLKLLIDEELLKKFSQGSRQMAMEYSPEKVTQLLVNHYNNVIKNYSKNK